MTIDYAKLANAPRLLLQANLRPLQGDRFQPTGFADLGPALYKRADGTPMLLVESAQSVANRMELACWDSAKDDLITDLNGLPFVRIDCGELGKTTTIKEFHRLNSPYLWEGADLDSTAKFRQAFLKDIGIRSARKKKGAKEDGDEASDTPGAVDLSKLYKAVLKWDINSVVHGVFLEKIAGRLRMSRLLSGFIEASNVMPAESGGAKVDHILPSPGEVGLSAETGFGNVPFHRTEFTAQQITAYFNFDLAMLRGYQFDDSAQRLLIALALFKISRFLSTGLRLRTACDLELENGLVVTRPCDGFSLPPEDVLLQECKGLINECKKNELFAGITEVKWELKEKPVEVNLPSGTEQPIIPEDLKGHIEWKKEAGKKLPRLRFTKTLTQELAEKTKALFHDNEAVKNAIDESLKKKEPEQADASSDNTDQGDDLS